MSTPDPTELPSGYTVSLRPEDQDLAAIHALISSTYWSPRIRRDVVEAAVRNSLVAGVFHTDNTGARRQIALARAVTDYATFAWIADVFVHESHRGRGLGKVMVEALLSDPRMKTIRRWMLATRDAHDLYRRYGFEDPPEGKILQRRHGPEVWAEPA
jgi:GNAT superfamily N-acetyltransferase